MRFVFLSAATELGGAERVLLDLLWSLRIARPDIDLHLISPGVGRLTEHAAALGVAIDVLPMPNALSRFGESHLNRDPGRDWWNLARQSLAAVPAAGSYVRRLRSIIDKIEPTIVHSNGIKTHLAAAAARPRGELVWHVHDFLSTRPLTARLLRAAARRAVGIIAVSNAVAQDCQRLVPHLPVATVPNAIDLGQFHSAVVPVDIDSLAGFGPKSGIVIRVGLVATYATWKGHDVFLEAAGRLSARCPGLPVWFYVVGGPIYQTRAQLSLSELQALAHKHGVENRVGFVPFQPNPAGVYAALDVVVHASTRPEPFGLTIAEAMACGRAVIVSTAGGAAELFTEGLDAVGVPPGDVAALERAIERLATDSDLRRQLGDCARETSLRRFDRNRLGPDVLAAYARFRSPSQT